MNPSESDKQGADAKRQIPNPVGVLREEVTGRWKAHLGFYKDKKALKFPNYEQRNMAIHLVWHDKELFGLPRNCADGSTMIVPAEAVELFRKKGIEFEEINVFTGSRR